MKEQLNNMMEVYIVPTHKNPELLFIDDYKKQIQELKAFYSTLPRDYWKRKIIEGEELGIIDFYHPIIDENIFVFNNTKNFKKAIKLLEDFINDELLMKLSYRVDELEPLTNPSLKAVVNRLRELEAKPSKIN